MAGDAVKRESARVLDVQITLERLAGDAELLGEIAQILLQTAPDQLNAIGEALAANDLKRTYEEAHSLKGAVAAFEAPEVFTSVAAIERHGRAQDGAAAAASFAEARVLVQELLGELAAFVPAA